MVRCLADSAWMKRGAGLLICSAITAGAHTYSNSCWPFLAESTAVPLRRATHLLEAATVVLQFLVVVLIDEGRVASLVDGRRLDMRGMLDSCKVCGAARRASWIAHHCRTCDVCIAGFDHHCTILGICVGRGNRPWFLALVSCAGTMLSCNAVAAVQACIATEWEADGACYWPVLFEGFYGGVIILIGAYGALLSALGLTQYTATRGNIIAALRLASSRGVKSCKWHAGWTHDHELEKLLAMSV